MVFFMRKITKRINKNVLLIILAVIIMKLYIKRDKTSDDSLFVIFDELGNEKYNVTRSKNTIYMFDSDNTLRLKVRQLPLPAIRAYSLTAGNRNIKFIMNGRPTALNCYYYGTSWHIRGDVFAKSFDIIDADNSLVATHCKRFSDTGDGYELNVFFEHSEYLSIGTAICVNLSAMVDNRVVQTV